MRANPDQLDRTSGGLRGASGSAMGPVQLFRPFEMCTPVVFGRVAVRSKAFAATSDAGVAPALVGSAAGRDEADVATRARGELVERVSNVLAGRVAERDPGQRASFAELRSAGIPALDPAAWPEAPPEAREVRALWVSGRSVIDGRDVQVLAGAAFLRHRPPPGCAPMVRAGSAGVAAHVDDEAAVDHALREVLERDLVWRAWYGDGAVRTTGLVPEPAWLARGLADLGLVVTGLVLPGPPRVATVVACLHTASRGEQSFGARCVVLDDHGRMPSVGLERAVFEALMVRWSMGTPPARQAWSEMNEPDPAPLPRTALEHAVWAFHGQDSMGYWLAKAAAGDPPDIPASLGVGQRSLGAVLADHTGEDVIAVDSTVPGIGWDDCRVVRIVAAGARRLPGDENVTRTSYPSIVQRLPHPLG